MESPKTRSPLKYKPLRLPEQSVQDDLDDLLLNTLMPFVLAVIFLGVLAGMEWLAVLRHTPRQPWLYTGMTAIAAGALGWQFQRVRRRAAQLRLGRDGERSVGQFLEGLREEGARVFHEVPGDRFNLDYVVLSAKGFYVIETKTRTKPASGHARVSLTTDSILVGRFKPERDPIDQVQAGARWLSDFLAPKALPAFIEKEPKRFEDADVQLAAYHLSRYIRAEQERVERRLNVQSSLLHAWNTQYAFPTLQ